MNFLKVKSEPIQLKIKRLKDGNLNETLCDEKSKKNPGIGELEIIRQKILGTLKSIFYTAQVLSVNSSKIQRITDKIIQLTEKLDDFINETQNKIDDTVSSTE